MQITSFSDFGMRAMMRLASDPQTPRSTAEIANEFGISRNHLTKAMAALARAGLIVTRRGGGGGASLARPADQISLGEIFRALNAENPLVECFRRDGGDCLLGGRCKLKGRLAAAKAAFIATLDESTLADIALDPQVFEVGAAQ